ncbi:MAG: hypothetical protein P4L64_14850 [Caulobacteraceae bacterium]|nr:hypothetical protein [Caulobacteraceae bacterium]
MKVDVIFDRDFGAKAGADLGRAFWLVESPPNRALAEEAWATRATDANSAVFKADDGVPLEDAALERLEDVDLHHPAWTEIAFLGIRLTGELQARLEALGLSVISGEGGFVVKR